MIKLSDFTEEVSKILNGTSTQIPTGVLTPTANLSFLVKSYASYFDNKCDLQTGKEYRLVYVAEPTGSFDANPDVLECEQGFTLYFYFPLTDRDVMYEYGIYFAKCVVGKVLTFGTSGKAVCNVDTPEFGAIESAEFKKFQMWVNSNYHLEINETDLYGTMAIKFYMSSTTDNDGHEFVYGNDASYSLIIDTISTTIEMPCKVLDSSFQLDTSVISQQKLDGSHTKSIGQNSTLGFSIEMYAYKDSNNWFKTLENKIITGDLINATCTLKMTTPLGNTFTGTKVITSAPYPLALGESLTFTLTLADRI